MDYNNYSTNYGAQGAADGGGFVGGEVNSSQAGGKENHERDTIRPVTIKQLIEAQQPHPDADFKIDGDTIKQVTFVGQINNIISQNTNVTYKVDDGTGIIEVKQWKSSDEDQDQMDISEPGKSKLVEQGYCRVWGRLKQFNNKRHVGAHIIRSITDYNEINYHLLEATAVHLFFKHGPPPSHQANGQTNGGIQTGQATETTASGKLIPSNLTPKAKMVYKFLMEQPQSNEGMHVQMIASGIGMEVNDVFIAGEELIAKGLTFTTVDDHTWAVLDLQD